MSAPIIGDRNNKEPIVIDMGPAGFVAQVGNEVIKADTREKLLKTLRMLQARNVRITDG